MQDQFNHQPDLERAAELIAKHLQRSLTDAEQEELNDWIGEAPWHKAYFERSIRPDHLYEMLAAYHQGTNLETELRAAIQEKMVATPVTTVHRVHFTWKQWFRAAAAAVILLATGGGYIWYASTSTQRHQRDIVSLPPAPIPAGREGAILTLEDGRQVMLDSIRNGVVATQSGGQVTVADGQLQYQPVYNTDAGGTNANPTTANPTTANPATANPTTAHPATAGTTTANGSTNTDGSSIAYNTVTTPKGRQYKLQLPDGTKVWLNAASRIRFPTAFNGAERKVTITGEAYLEVARSVNKPFRVSAAGTLIDVLGTSFNISAYEDDRYVAATLVDGSVKVTGKDAAPVVLKPGQQAVAGERALAHQQAVASQQTLAHQQALAGQHLKVDSNIDIEQVLAWKNGLFKFNSTDIHTVMVQLSRWYDIDVQYEGKMPNVQVSGKMDKGLNLNEIMEFLTKMDVKFKLTGRTVLISDK